jgi:Icc protein
VSAAAAILTERPAAVLVTGDIAHTGADREYEHARAVLARLEAPVFALPGNHDDRARLRRHFALPDNGRADLSYVADLGAVRLVALDTQDPGQDGGRFDPERQHWLADVLAHGPDVPTLLAMHHPPILNGVPAMDAIGLPAADRKAFADVVAGNRTVQLIVAGHVHRLITATVGGAAFVTIPSTTLQIALDLSAPNVRVVDEPPCFAIHLLLDGRLVSHIAPVANSVEVLPPIGGI